MDQLDADTAAQLDAIIDRTDEPVSLEVIADWIDETVEHIARSPDFNPRYRLACASAMLRDPRRESR